MTAEVIECGHDLVIGHGPKQNGARVMQGVPVFDVAQWRQDLTGLGDLSH